MIRITLPFPSPSLMPNRASGKHWTATREAKNHAFTEALLLTGDAVRRHTGAWHPLVGQVPLKITFSMPDRRGRDLDNLLAASKHSIDGIATALTINDRQFSPITIVRGEVIKGGAVLVEVGL
jgi:Holliday junction resolvase RusA-like endonuclease